MAYTIPVQVQAGAAFLDEHVPDWFTVIDTKALNLNSSTRCILGQIAQHPEILSRRQRVQMASTAVFASPFSQALLALRPDHISLYGMAFIEACDDPFKHPMKDGWKEAIRIRLAAKVAKDAEYRAMMDASPLAQQVRAGIDAELKKMYAERPTHVLAA